MHRITVIINRGRNVVNLHKNVFWEERELDRFVISSNDSPGELC